MINEKIIEKIKKEGCEEIVKLACENMHPMMSSVVFYNSETDSYFTASYTGGGYDDFPENIVEVYRLLANYATNSGYNAEDILDHEEYDDLLRKISEREGVNIDDAPDHCNVLDQDDLDLIGVSLTERIIDAMTCPDTISHIEKEIIRGLEQ